MCIQKSNLNATIWYWVYQLGIASSKHRLNATWTPCFFWGSTKTDSSLCAVLMDFSWDKTSWTTGEMGLGPEAPWEVFTEYSSLINCHLINRKRKDIITLQITQRPQHILLPAERKPWDTAGMEHVGYWFMSNSADSQSRLGRPCALHLVYILLHLNLAQVSTDSLVHGWVMAPFARAGT